MGVRITMHAVDVDRFAEFLEQPLGAILWYHAEYCEDDHERLWFTDSPNGSYIYMAIPGDGVHKWSDGKRYPVLADQWTRIAFLNTKARQFIDGGSPYDLDRLLNSLATIGAADFVASITSGHRRWWIGSLLDYAASAPELVSSERERLTELFKKVLCGYDCGWPLPKNLPETNRADFPMCPLDDPDIAIAVWNSEEARFLTRTLRRIRETQPRFKSPPRRVGLAPSEDADWNEWVYEMINQLLNIDEFDCQKLRIVSIID